MLLTVTSNVTAVGCGPVCILMDRIGRGTELEGNFIRVGHHLTNLGLRRCNEV